MDEPTDGVDMTMEDYHNFVIWYGCAPGDTVDAKSTIAVDFFRELKQRANNREGTVIIPNDMMTAEVGRGGEMMQKINHQLQLRHKDWQPR